MAKCADDQLRRHIDIERLTCLFRDLDEQFNGYERHVILAWLQDRVRTSPDSLAEEFDRSISCSTCGASRDKWHDSAELEGATGNYCKECGAIIHA
jgi:hypothetical protein